MAETKVLSNGLRIVGEQIPHLRSTSVGVWVKAGSMLEEPRESGLSHLMEHMSFKGTAHRNTKQLAEDMDAIGGQVNAATSKTATCYYARVLDEEIGQAMELLADIVRHPAIDESELEKEKSVVLEEIAMAEDSPEDIIFDKLNEMLYAGGTLSRPILGSNDTISALTREDMLLFRSKYYAPNNALVSIAGHFDWDNVLELAKKHFGTWKGGNEVDYPANAFSFSSARVAVDKDIEQVHLCYGFQGAADEDDASYPLAVFSNILGGGMSSRLFQTIREEHALAYNVFSSPTAYPMAGDFIIYAAATPRNIHKLMKELDGECAKLISEGITEKELEHTKIQLKTGVVLAQESAFHRMNSMGNNFLVRRRDVPVSEVLARIEGVSKEDVLAIAQKTLRGARSVALIGPNASKLLTKEG